MVDGCTLYHTQVELCERQTAFRENLSRVSETFTFRLRSYSPSGRLDRLKSKRVYIFRAVCLVTTTRTSVADLKRGGKRITLPPWRFPPYSLYAVGPFKYYVSNERGKGFGGLLIFSDKGKGETGYEKRKDVSAK